MKKLMVVSFLWLGLVLSLTNCSAPSKTYTCTRNTDSTLTFCQSLTGLTADQVTVFQTQCSGKIGSVEAGTWKEGSCSEENLAGKCVLSSGGFSATTYWYKNDFEKFTKIAMDSCTQSGGTYQNVGG